MNTDKKLLNKIPAHSDSNIQQNQLGFISGMKGRVKDGKRKIYKCSLPNEQITGEKHSWSTQQTYRNKFQYYS